MRCFLCVVALVFVSSLLCTIPAQQSHSETSISIPKEYVPAATDVPSILKKAEAGDAKAQLTLAVAYLAGIGVDKDQAESVKWLRKAADNNLMDAEELLGVFYSAGGTGVGHDDTEAFRWLSKAAAQGSPSAQMTVGYRYAMGVGVAEDHTAAAQWFKKAADQEYVDGEFFYGLALMNGDGVEKDTQAALGWLQTAADAGDGRACAAIAQIYGRGMGVPKDDVKAASFLRKAVDLTPDNKIFWNKLLGCSRHPLPKECGIQRTL